MDHTICENAIRSEHIVVKCIHHPEKKWTAKNIDFIGARSIFYKNAFGEYPEMGRECTCPINDLVHDHSDDNN